MSAENTELFTCTCFFEPASSLRTWPLPLNFGVRQHLLRCFEKLLVLGLQALELNLQLLRAKESS